MPSANERPRVEIYTDGGCDPNPGPGGWGAVLRSGKHQTELAGYAPRTTNNRMEMTAAIEALRSLSKPCNVDLYTDSQYLKRGITEWLPGWLRRKWMRANGSPVLNVDLWKDLYAETQRHSVSWHWIRGHRGHRWNERADALATRARRSRTPRLAQHSQTPPENTQAPDKADTNKEVRLKPLPAYEIYGRGCALGTPGPAGYAALIVDAEGNAVSRKGAWPLASNNEMELWAVIAGLQALTGPSRVTIYTPSQYVLGGATRWLTGWERNGWRTAAGKGVKNRELWQELSVVMGDHDISWEHLGRDNHSDWADQAAAMAREQAEMLREREADK